MHRTPDPLPPFRLGAVEGTTPGKWIDRWREQRPTQPLELVPLALTDQRLALDDDRVDAALVRLPIDETGLHLVRLYDDTAVVAVSSESNLTVADTLSTADLVDEVVIRSTQDAFPGLALPGTREAAFDPLETIADVIATVATGVGIAVMPASLVRLHHRRDVVARPLVDGPVSPVALAWPRAQDTESVQAFVGITRGRTVRSSR